MSEFGRMVWKEYRTQRALWLAILASGIALQLLFHFATSGQGPDLGAFGAAITFSFLYALASSAVLFAAEREDGTRELLRQLAPSVTRLLAAKIGFVIVSVALMLVLLWLTAVSLSKEMLPIEYHGQRHHPWELGLLLCAHVVVWGLFFSLLTQRVLNAVCLTAVVATGVQYFDPYNHYALPAVLAIDVWLARRWLTGGDVWQWPAHDWLRGGLTQHRAKARAAQAVETRSAASRPLVRLVWHEWRQARAFAGIAIIGGGLLFALLGFLAKSELAYALLPLAPLVMGLRVFQSEQVSQRFRFLTERGIAPAAVWLSKQVVWLCATVLVCLIWGAAFWISASVSDYPPQHESRLTTADILTYVALAYGLGQLLSMLFPRAVTAVFVGVILLIFLAVWQLLMTVLGVPLIWSVGTIPLVFMVATLVHARFWMLERRSTAVWLRLTALVLLPMLLLIAGVAFYRVWEIPSRSPGFDVADTGLRATPQETETAEQYRRAEAAIVPSKLFDRQYEVEWQAKRGWPHATAMEREALAANALAIDLTLKATAQPEGVFYVRGDAESWMDQDFSRVHVLGMLLLLSARQLEADGKLDEALDRYVAVLRLARHAANGGSITPWLFGQQLQQQVYEWLPLWAAAKGQDAQQIAIGRRRITHESASFPPASEAVKVEYAVMDDLLSQDLATQARIMGDSDDDIVLHLLDRLAPWERARSQRILNNVTAEQVVVLQELEQLLARPGTDLIAWSSTRFAEDRPELVNIRRWQKTTPLLFQAGLFYANSLALRRIETETYRSACLTTLPLVLWRTEHEHLPPRLDELGGEMLQHALDPWSGQLLGYLPDDSGEPLKFANASLRPPLLWSTGADNARVLPSGETNWDQPKYRVFPGYAGVRLLRESRGIGLGFAIP